MNVKKVTKKDRYGNSTTVEYEAPTKPLDPTALMKAQMEEQHSHAMHMMQSPPPVGGEEFVPGNPMTHPGEPKGQDTVPAWLTPGEFVVNAEAMSIPENAAMVEQINNQGRAMQNGGYLNEGGEVSWREKLGLGDEQLELVKGFWQDPLNKIPSYEQYAPEVWTKFMPQYQNHGGWTPPPQMPEGFWDGPEAVQAPPMKPYMGEMPMPRPSVQERRPQADLGMLPMMPDEYMIKKREGYNPEVYEDSRGNPTVGYGHKLPAGYTDQVGNQPYSEAELDMFFDKDIAAAQRAAKENIGLENFEQLSRQQQAALTSMAFQLGPAGQRKFKKMIAAIQRGDHTAAAYEALTGSEGGKSKWLRQTPKRALDLAMAFDPNVAAQYRQAGGSIYEDDMSTMTMDIPFDPDWTMDESAVAHEPEPTPEPTGRGEHWLYDFGVDDYWKEMGPGGSFEQFLDEGFEEVAEPGHVNIDPDTPQGEIYKDVLGQEVHDDLLSGERTIWDPEIAEGDSQELDALKSHNANLWLESARDDLENRPSSATLAEYKEAEAYAAATNAEYNENTKARNDAAEARQRQKEADDQEIAEILDDVPPKERTRKPINEVDSGKAVDTLVSEYGQDLPEEEQTGPDPDQPGNNASASEVEQAGKNVPPEEKKGIMDTMKNFFGDLLDEKELFRAAVMYAGSRALGYSHVGSIRYAGQQYATRVEAKHANRAANAQELAKSGKWTAGSIAEFQKTGDLGVLQPAGAAYTPTGKTQVKMVDGKKVALREVKDADGGVHWQSANGSIVNPFALAKAPDYEPSFEKGTPEYRERRSRATSDAAGRFEEVFKNDDRFRVGENEWKSHTKIRPKQAADEFWAWSESMGLDPESDEALQIMTNAYQEAIADGKSGDVKPTQLKPYLENQYIREKTGSPELFITNDPKPGQRPTYVRGDKMQKLNRNVEAVASRLPGLAGLAPQDAASRVYDLAVSDWNKLGADKQKMYIDSASEGESGFYYYLNHRMAQLIQKL